MQHSPKVVSIVEDKEDLREALSLMIKQSKGLELGLCFASAEEAIERIHEKIPDAVLMDINLPQDSGIECVLKLKSRYPDILFLMCTAHEDTNKIFSSLQAGASGYILKTEGVYGIIKALLEMFDGGSPMSSSIARKVVESFNKPGLSTHQVINLTEREQEVLQYLARGFMNKEVAEHLSISTGTVRKHIQNIYEKLHVNTRVEAVNIFLNRQ